MCVVAPGKQPVTESEKALSTSSGHIIHLMPGDNHYDPSSFCIVIAWNGLNHYVPTYIMKHSSILQHRCSVISRLLSTATDLFGDIESDLDESKDEEMIEQFHQLRDQTVQANHLLAVRGLEHPKLPGSVGGPHPNDVKKHLTRKTPLPVHPEPLISHALQHPLDPDNAIKRLHPTPYLPPPPEELKKEDFQINPDDYKVDQPRCIKVPGQLAPGRLSYPKQRLLVSIPLPVAPEEGYPPAHPDSVAAKRYREEAQVVPAGEAELIETVQNLPVSEILSMGEVSRITHEDVPSVEETSKVEVKSGKSRITHGNVPSVEETSKEVKSQKSRITQPARISFVDRDTGENLHPCVCPPDEVSSDRIAQPSEEPILIEEDEEEDVDSSAKLPFSITSETISVEDLTVDDDTEDVEKTVKSLKRKHLPSRKSPRVKLAKLDLKKGVSSGLPKAQKKFVETLAKNIVSGLSGLREKQREVQPDRRRQGPPSSSFSSSQSSGRQRSVIEMYAQAARRIAQPSQASGSQRTGYLQPGQPDPPRRITQQHQQPQMQPQQKSSQPEIVQRPPLVLQQPRRIAHDPPQVRRRITQTQTQTQSSQEESSQPERGILRCTYCSYSTVRKESMTDHMRQHTGEKFKCKECPKDFFSKKALRLHVKTNHMNIDRCLCTQLGCNWSGKDYGLRTVHLYEEHGIGPAPVCDHPDCTDRGHFSNYRTLERHRETFHRTADFQCPYCEKKYKNQSNLGHHIEVTHKGKDKIQCDICGGFYASRKSLQAHQKRDHNK